MRILVVSQTYCEWNSRAKWRHIVTDNSGTDNSGTDESGTEIKIITPYYWPDVLSKVESKYEVIKRNNRVVYEVVPSKAYFLGHEIYHFYPGLARVIRDFKPDVIQVETGSNSLSLFQTLLIKIFYRMNFRVIFFSWINWKAKFGWKYRYFYQWIERFNLKRVSGGILGNMGALDIFEQDKNFLKKKSILPQLGTDLFTFSPAGLDEKIAASIKFKLPRNWLPRNWLPSNLLPSNLLPREKIIIGFAGRITKEKGLDYLLDAFLLVEEDASLVIAGDGDYMSNIRSKIIDLGLTNVILLGSLNHSEMPEFFRTLDIFILPSYDTLEWKEQFGQVLVQAMASNVAVIGSDAGEIPNVISDAGLIFKQKNVESLSECLKKLVLDKSLRIKLASKGYNRAINNYSHGVIARKTYEFWKLILTD